MSVYHVTAATTIVIKPSVTPYRHGAAVVFETGINALRWVAGAITTHWESHDEQ
jgi:hypothetical protein